MLQCFEHHYQVKNDIFKLENEYKLECYNQHF